jgi:hypothetical protein
MVSEGQVDALILGGTELPFILKPMILTTSL